MKKIAGFLLVCALLVPAVSFGATLKAGDSFILNKGDTLEDNIYIGASDVFIEGDVTGDVIVCGVKVLVSGNVSGDIVALCGDITILGDVFGDIRLVGANALISSNVTGDVTVTAGSVKLTSDSTVGKDVIIAGGDISLGGVVKGKVNIVGGQININAKIDEDVFVGSDGSIVLGEHAVIGGSLTYRAKKQSILSVSDNARIIGETIFEESKVADNLKGNTAKAFAVAFGVFAFFKFIACLVAILIVSILFKKFSRRVVKSVVKKPGRSFVVGLAVFVLVPAVVTTLFFTAIGSFVALIILMGYVILLMLGSIYSGILLGAWLQKIYTKGDDIVIDWRNALLGAIILRIITLAPLFGWLVGLTFFLFSFGSIAEIVYKKFWLEK